MKRMFCTSLFVICVMGANARGLFAGPFVAKHLPSDAKWLIHVDFDAVKSSKVHAMLGSKLDSSQDELMAHVQAFEQATGMSLERDFHGVTIFGRGFEDDDVVAIVHANFDPAKMVAYLKTIEDAPPVTISKLGTRDLYSWNDSGEAVHAVVHEGATLIGHSTAQLERQLKVMSGSVTTLAESSPLNINQPGGILVMASAEGIAQLAAEKGADTAFLNKVESGWLAISEVGDSLSIKASLNTKTPETATQLKSGIDGIRALITLAGDEAKEVSQVLAAVQLQAVEKSVNLNWTMSLESLSKLMDESHVKVDVKNQTDEPASTQNSVKVEVKVKKD